MLLLAGQVDYDRLDQLADVTPGSSFVLADQYNTSVVDNFESLKFGHIVVDNAADRPSAGEGTMVYQKDSDEVLVFATPGGSSVWVPVMPVGMVSPFAGSVAPNGWLLCQGQEVLRSAYPALDTVIGPAYSLNGAYMNGSGGAGSTHFRVPDLQGRMAVGKGTNGDVDLLGDNDGAALADRSPKHKHSIGNLSISNTLSVNPAGAHGHTNRASTVAGLNNSNDGFVRGTNVQDPSFANTNSVGDHSHTLAGSVSLTGSVGVGSGTNDTVPYLTLNYIIKV